ncbi:MAG: FixH family protein [Rhodospirillales bacterium]
MSTVTMNEKSEFRITGRMVFFGLVAFFGLIAAVNGVFMYFALDTFPGLTTEDSYRKGIVYNRTLDDAEAQKRLGWQSAVALGDGRTLTVTMTDRTGRPLSGALASISMTRPLGDETALTVDLEETADGLYRGDFAAPMPGRWKAEVTVRRGGDSYRMRHEVMVR